jgi:hypothetical protein
MKNCKKELARLTRTRSELHRGGLCGQVPFMPVFSSKENTIKSWAAMWIVMFTSKGGHTMTETEARALLKG